MDYTSYLTWFKSNSSKFNSTLLNTFYIQGSLDSKFGKLNSGHRSGKHQFSFQSQRRAMPKNAQTTSQLHSSHIVVMIKILQARFQHYVNHEFPDVQAGFKKAEGPEIKLPTSIGSSRKQESSRKTSISALLTMPKALTVWTTTNSGKFLKRWEYQTTWPVPEKSVCRSGSYS